MSPKKSSSGSIYSDSTSSSSSKCANCDQPLLLEVYGVSNVVIYTYLVLVIINIVTIVYCMILVSRRPWLHANGNTDRNRYWLYQVCGIFALVTLAINLVNTILTHASTSVTYSYVIIFIFLNLSAKISELLLLGVIFKSIDFARAQWRNTGRRAKLSIIHLVCLIVLALISGVSLSLYSYTWVNYLVNDADSAVPYTLLEVVYAALYFLVSIELVGYSIIFIVKQAIPLKEGWFFLMCTGPLVVYTTSNFAVMCLMQINGSYYYYATTLKWLVGYIALVVAIPNFVGLALMSRYSNHTVHKAHLDRRFSNTLGYASPSPYAASTPLRDVNRDQTYEPVHDHDSHHRDSYGAEVDTSYDAGRVEPWKPTPDVYVTQPQSVRVGRVQYTAVSMNEQLR